MVTELLVFAVVFLLCRLLAFRRSAAGVGPRRNLPPCPPGLPLVGNLAAFAGSPGRPVHATLRRLAAGLDGGSDGGGADIMGLRVLGKRFLVLGSSSAVREALGSADFAGRPFLYSLSLLSRRNCGIAFSDYGPALRGHRRDAVGALRMSLRPGPSPSDGSGPGRSIAETAILEEVAHVVAAMATASGDPVDPSDTLTVALVNTVCRLNFGRRYGAHDAEMRAFVSANHKLKDLFQPGHPLDIFPFLRIFPSKRMRTIQEIIASRDSILQAQYREHVASFRPGHIRDITDAFLQSMKDPGGHDVTADDDDGVSEDQVVMSMWEFFAGGFESTFQTLRWALAYLIHYPEVQKRLQDELDNNVPDGAPTWGDRSRLPYLEATVLETLRHSTFSSLNGPHETTCDTKLRNYDIPKGTTVLCNLWWIHHDPANWKEPDSFRPEHFLDGAGKVSIPRHFLPFSVGPRLCLGKQLAVMALFLFLGGLLRRFTLSSPPGREPPPLESDCSDPIRTIGDFEIVARKRESFECSRS